MNWYSVRTRLILWNVAVLAAVLMAFGLAIRYSVEASQARVIDRELERRLEGPPWGRGGRGGPGRGGREFWAQGRGPRPPWADRDGRDDERRGAGERNGPQQPERAPTAATTTRPGGEPRPGGRSEPGNGDRRTGESNEPPGIDFRRPRRIGRDGRTFGPNPEGPWDPRTFALSLAGKKRFSNITVDGEPARVLSVPLLRDGRVEGVVQVAHSLTEQQAMTAGLIRILLMLIPFGLLVAAGGALFLTDRALRPVREVTHAAAQIEAEDLSQRLTVTGRDEIAELAATFNSMIARLEGAFSRLRGAFEEQRRFTSDASHELRTPLTAVKANTSLALMEERSPAEYRAALEAADQAADVMARIVQDLLFLARSDAGQLLMETQPTSLEQVARRAAALVTRAEGPPVQLALPADPVVVLGDEHHLVRVVTNLLENALRHTPAEGRVEVSVAMEQGGTGVVRVRDTGEGIPPEHLPRICERFYRVDAARARSQGGTGLGLAICQSIVQAHGGTLAIDSVLERGTTVTLRLPGAVTVDDPNEPVVTRPERARALGGAKPLGDGLPA